MASHTLERPAPAADQPARIHTDVLVVGAGPTGLFAAYCAGYRGLGVAVVDALPELGGQVSALYPEKIIHDVAGHPGVLGRDLVSGLAAQALRYDPLLLLGHRAEQLRQDEPDSVVVTTGSGLEVHAGAVVITGGIGAFTPRPLPAATEFGGPGVAFFVPDPEIHRGRDVVVVGGGDSAFDWACMLHSVAASVTLVHRRAAFRAHRATVDEAHRLGIRIVTDAEVIALDGGGDDGALASVTVRSLDDGAEQVWPCQGLVAALGFTARLGPLGEWGLDVVDRRIVVDSRMSTGLPRVFAAGDITHYPGKVRLMAVGFGEAATAVNNAAVLIDPELDLFPGHSTDGAPATAPAPDDLVPKETPR